jgi:hypothetical protein
MMALQRFIVLVVVSLSIATTNSFVVRNPFGQRCKSRHTTTCTQIGMAPLSDGNEDGAQLAAELFRMAQAKGIRIEQDELMLNEEDEEEDDDEEDEPPKSPPGEVLLGEEQLVDDETVSLTDSQLYSEVKERVLDTAGGFLDFVKAPTADDDDEEDEDDDDEDESNTTLSVPKPYVPPETIPDAALTAGEVIMVVLDALLNNNIPTKHAGVEILFGFSSEHSQVKNEAGLTVEEYAEFLQDSEYKVLFSHDGATIDKGDYSFDGKRAFFTARLQTGKGPLDTTSVNFILSTTGKDENACWLIDSMLIRPESMRRRRRR